MAAKIQLELENTTAAGFAQLQSDLQQSEAEAGKFARTADELRESLSAKWAAQFRDAVRDLSEEFATIAGRADLLRDRIANVGKGMKGFISQAGGASALTGIFSQVGQTIQLMADNGNVSMQSLVNAAGDVQRAFLEIADDPEISAFAQSIADGLTSTVVPAIKEIPGYWRATQDAIVDTTLAFQEWIGLVPEGTTAVADQMQAERQQSLERAKAQQEAAKRAAEQQRQQETLEKQVSDIARRRWADEEAARAAQVSSLEEIESLYEEQLKTLREGPLTDEKREQGVQKLQILEQRRKQIIQENAQAEKEAAAEADALRKQSLDFQRQRELDAANERFRTVQEGFGKEITALEKQNESFALSDRRREENLTRIRELMDDSFRATQEEIEAQTDAAVAAADTELEENQARFEGERKLREAAAQHAHDLRQLEEQEAEKHQQKAIADFEARVNRIQSAVAGKDGAANGTPNAIEQIRGNLSQKDVLAEVAAKRAEPELEKLKEKQQRELEAYQQSEDFTPQGAEALKKRQAAEQRRLQKETQRDVFRQARRGTLDQGEVTEAQDSLIGKVIEQGADSNQLGKEQAAALKQAAQAIAQQNQEQRQLAEDVKQVQQFLKSLSNDRGRMQGTGLGR